MGFLTGSVDDFIAKYLATPKAAEVGIGGWPSANMPKFWGYTLLKRRALLENEVTSTYVEDGSFLSDHIVQKPMPILLEGVVGDMHLKPSPLLESIRRAEAEIGNITQFLPDRTQTQETKIAALTNDALNQVRLVDSYIAAGGQVLNLVQGSPETRTPQQDFASYMHAVWANRWLLAVDFPLLGAPAPMALRSVQFEESNQSGEVHFTLELLQVRVATIRTEAFANVASGAAAAVKNSPVDKGAQKPEALGSVLIESLKVIKEGVGDALRTLAPNVAEMIK